MSGKDTVGVAAAYGQTGLPHDRRTGWHIFFCSTHIDWHLQIQLWNGENTKHFAVQTIVGKPETDVFISRRVGQPFLPLPEDGFVVGFHIQPELGVLQGHLWFRGLASTRIPRNDVGVLLRCSLCVFLQQKQEVL